MNFKTESEQPDSWSELIHPNSAKVSELMDIFKLVTASSQPFSILIPHLFRDTVKDRAGDFLPTLHYFTTSAST